MRRLWDRRAAGAWGSGSGGSRGSGDPAVLWDGLGIPPWHLGGGKGRYFEGLSVKSGRPLVSGKGGPGVPGVWGAGDGFGNNVQGGVSSSSSRVGLRAPRKSEIPCRRRLLEVLGRMNSK